MTQKNNKTAYEHETNKSCLREGPLPPCFGSFTANRPKDELLEPRAGLQEGSPNGYAAKRILESWALAPGFVKWTCSKLEALMCRQHSGHNYQQRCTSPRPATPTPQKHQGEGEKPHQHIHTQPQKKIRQHFEQPPNHRGLGPSKGPAQLEQPPGLQASSARGDRAMADSTSCSAHLGIDVYVGVFKN